MTQNVTRWDGCEVVRITHVEGQPLSQHALVRILSEGETMLMVEVTMPAGESSPSHVHDHESVGYVVRGRVRMTVGNDTTELGPGDAFLHPIGLAHSLTAIGTEAVWLEIKSPPTRTWE